jgi:hypothetical protein
MMKKGIEGAVRKTVQAMKFEIESLHVVATDSQIHIGYNILVSRKLQAAPSIWSRIWMNYLSL